MKVAVYVRDLHEIEGLFIGHADHSELESVTDMFRRGDEYPEAGTYDVYLPRMPFDPKTYVLYGAQFMHDRQEKNLIFEIILGTPDA